MEILIALVPFILLVLFVFALLLMLIGIGRYTGYLSKESEKNRSQLNGMLSAFRFIVFANVSGSLSFFKVLLASCFISLLITLGIVIVKLAGS